MKVTVVLSRDSSNNPLRGSFENRLAEMCCTKSGWDVRILPHIYHLPDGSEVWHALPTATDRWVFLSWLHPRPAAALLACHGHEMDSSRVFNMGAFQSAEDCYLAITEVLELTGDADGSTGGISEITSEVTDRWYPVIDRSRCIDCGHCLQFCIFTVYEYDAAHRVVAINPDNCKQGCPACSRVCPHGAIIFPLYAKDDAIAGAPGLFVMPDAAAAQKMHVIRDKTPCPVCGQIAAPSRMRRRSAAEDTCPACGCPQTINAEPASRLSQDAIDDIDLLINDLENLTRGDRD